MHLRSKTPHYGAARWVDFVRGLVSGADHKDMQAHLDTGCVKCQELAHLYARVAARAATAAQCELPEAVVQQAREIFNHAPGRAYAPHGRRRKAA